MDGSANSYDVHELTARLARLRRVGRITAPIGVAVGVFALADSLLRIFAVLNGGQTWVSYVGVGFGLIVTGMSLWGASHWRRGAREVTVDEAGVHLDYGQGRRVDLDWTNPHVSFQLEDGSVLPPQVTAGGLLYTLNTATGDTPLTKEAFSDILTRAQALGLVVRSGRARVFLFPPSMWPMRYRIRGSAPSTTSGRETATQSR